MKAQRRERIRPWIAGAVAVALGVSLWSGSSTASLDEAQAFGTVDGLLGQSTEHERITRRALECPGGVASDNSCFEPQSLLALAGGPGTFGGVGAPDSPGVGGEINEPAAHCDNADYFAQPKPPGIPTLGYRQSRAQASAALLACINHIKGRFNRGAELTAGLSLAHPEELNIEHCTVSDVRDKCLALEQFGRALHGVQDFYSHSNWTDQSDQRLPVSISNPPGLNLSAPSPLLNMRATITAEQIPLHLTTGCANFLGACIGRDRITHETLNKDLGRIPETEADTVYVARTPRGMIRTNFANAVIGAIEETRTQWASLKAELAARLGAALGEHVACVLTHDHPTTSCPPPPVPLYGSGILFKDGDTYIPVAHADSSTWDWTAVPTSPGHFEFARDLMFGDWLQATYQMALDRVVPPATLPDIFEYIWYGYGADRAAAQSAAGTHSDAVIDDPARIDDLPWHPDVYRGMTCTTIPEAMIPPGVDVPGPTPGLESVYALLIRCRQR